MNGLTGCDDILCYISLKPWQIAFSEAEYEEILSREIMHVSDATSELVARDGAHLLFVIVWNDLTGDWNRSIPFLADLSSRAAILKYMWLLHNLGLPGTTKFIFESAGIKSPNMILSFRADSSFRVSCELRDGIPLVQITLSENSDTFKYTCSLAFDEISHIEVEQISTFKNLNMLRIKKYKYSLDNEWRTQFQTNIDQELQNKTLRTFLVEILRAINSSYTDDQTLRELYGNLALIYDLITKTSQNAELVYFFNSSNIIPVRHDEEVPAWREGGCLVLLGEQGNIPYKEYYLISAFSLAKLSSVQKIFRIRAELNHALRSAVAAIMGRVLAHDWSHLLVHAELPETHKEDWFRHFKSYLKERMVFVADVTTSRPSWRLSLPFVSQVVRPFTHVPLSTPMHLRTAVSQYIAQSEGVTEINVKVYHGDKLIELKYDKQNGMWLVCPTDVYISIPSGIVGNHALYCLLENFARNSAKYSPKPERPEVLNISLRLDEEGFEGSDELYRVRIWDDRSHYDEKSLRRVCEFFPPGSLKHLPPQFQSPNKNWQIIDDNGQVISGGWGIKEMRIAAAWLRGLPPDEALLSEESIQPSLLRPILVTKDGCITDSGSTNEVYMGYELYLLKPKEALIIDRNIDLNQYDIQGLRRVGIDLETDLEQVKKSHHYLCFVRLPDRTKDADRWLKLIDQQRQDFPARALLVVSEQSPHLPLGTCTVGEDLYTKTLGALLYKVGSPPKHILKAYKCWLRKVMGAPERLALVLHINPAFDRETPQGVLTLWEQTAKEFNELFAPWKMYVVKKGICGAKEQKYSATFALNASLPQCPENLIVYDYHSVFSRGSAWKKEDTFFVEEFGGTHPTHSVLYNPPTGEWARLKTALGLVEAAVAKTVIVDERIWRRLKQSTQQNGVLASKVRATRIEVPEDFNYEQPGESDAERLLQLLKQDRKQILIIHQGILDKVFQDKAQVKREIEEWVEKVKEDAKVPFIVVISDRGTPENVPDNARFADYALVDKFVSEVSFSKFYLIQSVLAATSAQRRR